MPVSSRRAPGAVCAFLAPFALPTRPARPTHNKCAVRASDARPSAQVSARPADVRFLSLENNTFVLEYGARRILVDPWLSGDLVFLTPAFYRNAKPLAKRPLASFGEFDALVLTQGLPDHAHRPTLERLPKHLPVIAPQSAEALLRELGFRDVTIVTYGDVASAAPGVRVKAGRGSVVGPPWSPPELAYVFSFGGESASESRALNVYHEPHGNHDAAFLNEYRGKLDAVIAPFVSSTLPVLGNYSLVNGIPEALQLCKAAKPRVCVAFDNSGGEQSGFLKSFLRQEGGREQFDAAVRKESGLSAMRIIYPSVASGPVVILPASELESTSDVDVEASAGA